MPTYEISLPDGRKYEVEAPEGADLRGIAMKLAGSADEASPQSPAAATATLKDTVLAPFYGFNKSLADLVAAPARFGNWISDVTGFKPDKALGLPEIPRPDDWPVLRTYLNPPKPRTTAQRYLQAMGGGIGAAAIPGGGMLAAAPRMAGMAATNLPRAVVQSMGAQMAAAPGAAAIGETVAAAGAGVGQQMARDAGAGTVGQIAGGMLGALAPGAAIGTLRAAGRAGSNLVNAEKTQQARQVLSDMEQLGVRPAPSIVATARNDGYGPGTLAKMISDKPVWGTPLQREARHLNEDMERAMSRIQDGYGSTRSMQGGGAAARGALERVRNERSVDVSEMNLADLERLANAPVRLNTFRDVQAGKYALAERYLPEDRLGQKPVGKGQPRDQSQLRHTKAVLNDIKRRYGLTINKTEAAMTESGKPNGDFGNPRWTSSADINRSLDAIEKVSVTSKGKRQSWNTGIQGLREIRSNIRRLLSAKADTEVNALARGDLKRLYKAISMDMDEELLRNARKAEAQGLADEARQWLRARDAYREADRFTRRYMERFEEVKTLFRVQSDEAVAGAIKTAMMDGTRGNLKRLVALRRLLPREVIDEINAAILTDLGRPASYVSNEPAFSPVRFATQWGKLSPKARKIMFGNRPGLLRQLDRFARIAQHMKDFEALANHSRTGVSNFIWTTIGAGGASAAMVSPSTAASVAAGLLAGRLTAKWLTSERYLAWLTRTMSLERLRQTGRITPARYAVEDAKLMSLFERLQQIEPMPMGVPAMAGTVASASDKNE